MFIHCVYVEPQCFQETMNFRKMQTDKGGVGERTWREQMTQLNLNMQKVKWKESFTSTKGLFATHRLKTADIQKIENPNNFGVILVK